MERYNLTKKEIEVMNILWDCEKPMLVSEIFDNTKTISKSSIHFIINNLLDKGFIRVAGIIKVVKTPSRLYVPAVSVEEYAAAQSATIFKETNKKFNLKGFLLCLEKNNKDKDLAEELKHIIDTYEDNDK